MIDKITSATVLCLLAAVFACAAGLACGTTPGETPTGAASPQAQTGVPEPAVTLEPTETATPTAEPTPTEEPAVMILQDDFADVESGWERYREWDGVLDYEDDGYRMWINVPSNLFWVSAGLDVADVVIEVDAEKIGGPDANQFGVLCRQQAGGAFDAYGFLISSDGRFGIARVALGVQEFIGGDGMVSSEAIRQGEAANHIRAACVGNTLTLFVNGQLLLEVEDDGLAQGDVGLAVGTVGELGADILFDNLVLWEP